MTAIEFDEPVVNPAVSADDIAGLLALKEGLPPGPWCYEDSLFVHGGPEITSDTLLADVFCASTAKAFASVPSMLEAIERQATDFEAQNNALRSAVAALMQTTTWLGDTIIPQKRTPTAAETRKMWRANIQVLATLKAAGVEIPE